MNGLDVTNIEFNSPKHGSPMETMSPKLGRYWLEKQLENQQQGARNESRGNAPAPRCSSVVESRESHCLIFSCVEIIKGI